MKNFIVFPLPSFHRVAKEESCCLSETFKPELEPTSLFSLNDTRNTFVSNFVTIFVAMVGGGRIKGKQVQIIETDIPGI